MSNELKKAEKHLDWLEGQIKSSNHQQERIRASGRNIAKSSLETLEERKRHAKWLEWYIASLRMGSRGPNWNGIPRETLAHHGIDPGYWIQSHWDDAPPEFSHVVAQSAKEAKGQAYKNVSLNFTNDLSDMLEEIADKSGKSPSSLVADWVWEAWRK